MSNCKFEVLIVTNYKASSRLNLSINKLSKLNLLSNNQTFWFIIMKENAKIRIIGKNVILIPYESKHVAK